MPFFLEQDKSKTWVERNGELVWGAIGLAFLIFFLTMMVNGFYLLCGASALGAIWSTYRLEMFRRSQAINSVPTNNHGDGGQSPGRDFGGFGGGDA
ncbi:hypothetical protein [Ruegeria lacuscaerulensis]|uniref:hypothetical protein n=1 Tax=Ruegeria lacuscaerulensis TaxID=55218 RepID=UPI00147EEB97|nr:hypothetical protein [Ruegeria lacuscaerulensis]